MVRHRKLAEQQAAVDTKAAPAKMEKARVPTWTRLQLINVGAFIVCMILNAVCNMPGRSITGQTNSDISNTHKTAFTPAGYAFSIWGLIYTLCGGFVVLQALPSRAAWTAALGPWFAVNMVSNGLWNVAFTGEWGKLWVSIFIIAGGILIPLLVLQHKLGIGAKDDEATPLSLADLLFARCFVSIYAGWVCVATIANVSVTLTPRNGVADLGWTAANWSILMQAVATVLALTMLLRKRDAPFVGPIAWALFAIAVQQKDPAFPGGPSVVAAAQAFGSIVASAGGGLLLFKGYRWWSGKAAGITWRAPSAGVKELAYTDLGDAAADMRSA